MQYELDGQKFRVIGKSSVENPPKEGMWIVCSRNFNKIPGKIYKHFGCLKYHTAAGGNAFYGGNDMYWNEGSYSILEPIVAEKRSHKNTKRLTARERTVMIINGGALAVDIERQLKLHAKAALARKAKR